MSAPRQSWSLPPSQVAQADLVNITIHTNLAYKSRRTSSKMEAEKLAEQNNNRDERQQAIADAGGARPNDKNFIPTMTKRAEEFFGPGGFDKVIEQLSQLVKEGHEISMGKAVDDLGLTESHLCGAPYGEASQGWPHCGECSKSMSFVAQLNT